MINNDAISISKIYTKKELCSLLNIAYSNNGKSRIKMNKEIDRLCTYIHPIKNNKEQKTKYILTQIYETPKEKIDGRGKSLGTILSKKHNEFGISLDKLILFYLNNNDYYNDSLKNFFMTNEDENNKNNINLLSYIPFIYYYKDLYKELQNNNLPFEYCNKYIFTLKKILTNQMESSLNRLNKKYNIEWYMYYRCICVDKNIINLPNNYNEYIKTLRNNIAIEMGYKHYGILCHSGKDKIIQHQKLFINELNNYLNIEDETKKINYIYKCYFINSICKNYEVINDNEKKIYTKELIERLIEYTKKELSQNNILGNNIYIEKLNNIIFNIS